jgi:hypothetical protein
MTSSIRVHLADFDAIPLSLLKRLVLASVAMFPSSYSYNPISGVIEVDCNKLADEWSKYVQSNEFDENVKQLLNLLDGSKEFRAPIIERAQKCGAGKLQDLAKRYASNPCSVLQDLIQVSIAYDMQKHALQVLWGSATKRIKLVPFIVKAPEFMESARVFPARQLVTVKEKGHRDVPVEGFERAIEISCHVYTAIIIGAARTYLGRVQKQDRFVYYFLVPDTPDRDLCVRVSQVFEFIKSVMGFAETLSETLWYLFLITAIRSFTGSATLYGVYIKGKPGRLKGGIDFELRVYFDSVKPLSLVLEDVDKGLAVPKLIIAAAELLQSEDPDRRRLGKALEEALHSFAKLAFGIVEPSQSALHMLRILMDGSTHSLIYSLGDEGEKIAHYINVLIDASQELLKLSSAGVR